MVNEWTRKDLPDFGAMGSVMARWKVSYGAVSDVLDAVVAHLNANGGTPAGDRDRDALVDQPDVQTVTIGALKYERDRWRRAHAIVEQERDTARESLRESYGLARSLNVEAHQATKRAEAAERERDEAVEASALFQRDVHAWRTRAEAAEARTTHARTVTREDVEKAIRAAFDGGGTVGEVREMTDTVCDLLGIDAEPADPVTEKARELAGVMHEAIKDERVEWHTAPAAVDAMAARLAAHVLGQEAGDE